MNNARRFALVAVAAFLALPAAAAEIRVLISGGFSAAYRDLGAKFERASGHTLHTEAGPSMGATPQAIPNRIDRGEPVDVVIMVGDALGKLVDRGKVAERVDLGRSLIAMAVKEGAPRPDISTLDAFKRTVLAAKSIVYSDSASGVYLQNTLFPRLGLWEEIKGKSRMVPAEPVGQVVARGEAEIGFQQMSELKPVSGIDIVGYLPEGAQVVTVFSGGLSTTAKEPAAGRALLRYLSSPEARADIIRSGLEPISQGGPL